MTRQSGSRSARNFTSTGRDVRPSVPTTASSPEATGCGHLTAAELVERLEREQAMVDRYERGRRTGAAALLRAALQRRAHAPSEASSECRPADATAPAGHWEAAVARLDELARHLDDQAERLAEQGAGDADARPLLNLQEHLADRLDALLADLPTVESEPEPARRAA